MSNQSRLLLAIITLILTSFILTAARQHREVQAVKARIVVLESELHVIKQEAVKYGYARWEGQDENVSFFCWNEPHK